MSEVSKSMLFGHKNPFLSSMRYEWLCVANVCIVNCASIKLIIHQKCYGYVSQRTICIHRICRSLNSLETLFALIICSKSFGNSNISQPVHHWTDAFSLVWHFENNGTNWFCLADIWSACFRPFVTFCRGLFFYLALPESRALNVTSGFMKHARVWMIYLPYIGVMGKWQMRIFYSESRSVLSLQFHMVIFLFQVRQTN